MGTVFDTVVTFTCWALTLVLAEVTVSSLVRIARARFRQPCEVLLPDRGLTPLSGSACLALLAFLSVRPQATGIAAVILFAVAVLPIALDLARKTRANGLPAAARATAVLFATMAWKARQILASDLRMLAARRPASPAAGRAGRRPGWTAAAPRPRDVPHLLDDPYLGAHPYPADIAASLELEQVPVPPHWDRLAQVISDTEFEDDDDTTGTMTGEAAGVLTVAAAIENRTENLAAARGLAPEIIAAHFDIAEAFADLATRYALLARRDHLVHGELREWVDNGGVLAHDARQWHNAGGPDGGGGRAA